MVTGAVQSRKTTRLLNWVINKNDVYGILTPVVNGKRFFNDVYTKELFDMEASPGDNDPLSIGKFQFDKRSFEKASQIIRNALDKKGWLIIDEIGPLELQQKGFYSLLPEVLHSTNYDLKIILVVREGLMEQVKSFFELHRFSVSLFDFEAG